MIVDWVKSFYDNPQFERGIAALGAADVIKWWEARRVFFNMVLLLTGFVTCTLLLICAFTSEAFVGEAIGMSDGPLLGLMMILVYVILANICYTAGWISELTFMAVRRTECAAVFGRWAFRAGLTFSVLLTLLPAAVCWLAFAFALAHGQTHGPASE